MSEPIKEPVDALSVGNDPAIRICPVCGDRLEHCNERREWTVAELIKHRAFLSYRRGRITLARYQELAALISLHNQSGGDEQ